MTMTEIKLTRAEKIKIIRKRDGDNCYLCQTGFLDKEGKFTEKLITLDHYIPRSKGGSWDIENLRLACKPCNAKKGDRIFDENGQLPKLRRELKAEHKALKRSERPPTCHKCNNGRWLGPDDVCDVCDSVAQPYKYPRWAKLAPKDCPHSGPWWCWAEAIGIYERVPASEEVFEGNVAM